MSRVFFFCCCCFGKVWDLPYSIKYETLSNVNCTIIVCTTKKEKTVNHVTPLIMQGIWVSEMLNLESVYIKINNTLLYCYISSS